MAFHFKTFLICLFAVSSYAFAFRDPPNAKPFAPRRPEPEIPTKKPASSSHRTSLTSRAASLGHAASDAVKSALPSPPSPATALKSPSDLYQAAVTTGTNKGKSSVEKIFLLGLIAGCHIGFGAYLALCVAGNVPSILTDNPGLQKLLFGAFGLPAGLIMTVVTGGELFTGNTALVTAARTEGKVTTGELFKSWITSYAANLIASVALAWLCFQTGTLGTSPGAVNVANAKCSMTWGVAFLRGVLGNWLVCMAIYIANGCSDMVGKMTAVWVLISAFTAMGFDHSVANMFFIPLGIFKGANISWLEMFTKNLIPVSLGNIVGGALCVMGPYGATFGSLRNKNAKLNN